MGGGGGGGGRIMALLLLFYYSFPLISPERLELRPSNFLTFSFYLLAIKKYKYVIFRLHLLPWQPFCREYFDQNHKNYKVMQFLFSFVLVHSFFPIIIVDMVPKICKS